MHSTIYIVYSTIFHNTLFRYINLVRCIEIRQGFKFCTELVSYRRHIRCGRACGGVGGGGGVRIFMPNKVPVKNNELDACCFKSS
jgi:hypothetical protein